MTSNEKFQPGEEMFEDVEAHGFRGNVGSEEPTEDVEGHAIRSGRLVADDDEDDTEGHAMRGK